MSCDSGKAKVYIGFLVPLGRFLLKLEDNVEKDLK